MPSTSLRTLSAEAPAASSPLPQDKAKENLRPKARKRAGNFCPPKKISWPSHGSALPKHRFLRCARNRTSVQDRTRLNRVRRRGPDVKALAARWSIVPRPRPRAALNSPTILALADRPIPEARHKVGVTTKVRTAFRNWTGLRPECRPLPVSNFQRRDFV